MARPSASLHLPGVEAPPAVAAVPQATAAKASSVRWRIFAIVFALTMVNLIDRVSLSIAMPTIAHEFSLSPSMQELILSRFFCACMLGGVRAGDVVHQPG